VLSGAGMQAEVGAALLPLLQLPIWAAGRTGDLAWFQIGDRRVVQSGEDGHREVGTYALHIACPWRLVDRHRLLVGSGDLLTPADPEAEIETFDWDEPGSNWLDVRLAELWAGFGAELPTIQGVEPDPYGGFGLHLTGGMRLEAFPNSTPTGHVATEFWRLLQPSTAAPHFVVGTFGVERDEV
jgi:hypothetical protein